MPKFRVESHRDAWINYESIVEAANAAEATALVQRAWETGDESVSFSEIGESKFDELTVDESDVELLEDDAA